MPFVDRYSLLSPGLQIEAKRTAKVYKILRDSSEDEHCEHEEYEILEVVEDHEPIDGYIAFVAICECLYCRSIFEAIMVSEVRIEDEEAEEK